MRSQRAAWHELKRPARPSKILQTFCGRRRKRKFERAEGGALWGHSHPSGAFRHALGARPARHAHARPRTRTRPRPHSAHSWRRASYRPTLCPPLVCRQVLAAALHNILSSPSSSCGSTRPRRPAPKRRGPAKKLQWATPLQILWLSILSCFRGQTWSDLSFELKVPVAAPPDVLREGIEALRRAENIGRARRTSRHARPSSTRSEWFHTASAPTQPVSDRRCVHAAGQGVARRPAAQRRRAAARRGAAQ